VVLPFFQEAKQQGRDRRKTDFVTGVFQAYFFTPLAHGKKLFTWGKRVPTNSPIHVSDCACALAHLLE
jgi:hypothetical protein